LSSHADDGAVETCFQSDSISICLFYIYFYRYNFSCLGEHVMFFWNLLYGGASHSGPVLGPSESLRGGTHDTNPRQSLNPSSILHSERCLEGVNRQNLKFTHFKSN
jgi:hypothetical protein